MSRELRAMNVWVRMSLLTGIVLVALFAVGDARAGHIPTHDDCPGGSTTTAYTCATADNLTCNDVNGTQYRSVTCYPPDTSVGLGNQCNDNSTITYRGTCTRPPLPGVSSGSPYICQPSDNFDCAYAFDVAGVCNCAWGSCNDNYARQRTDCYPDADIYGAWVYIPGELGGTCLTGNVCNVGVCGYDNTCHANGTIGGTLQMCFRDGSCTNATDQCIGGICYTVGGSGDRCRVSPPNTCDAGLYCCTTTPNTMCMTNPVANFSVVPSTTGNAPFLVGVSFTGTAYGAATYAWDFGDSSPTVFGANATHTYQNFTVADISRTITLTLTDQCGGAVGTRTATRTVTVRPMLPTASFTVTPSSGTSIPLSVTANANGSGSTATGATIISYQWDFGDNTASYTTTSRTTSHIYTNKGVYTAMLRVLDMIGWSDWATQIVTVGETSCDPACSGTAPICAAPPPACFGASVSPPNPGFGTTSVVIGKTNATAQVCVYAKYDPADPILHASSTMSLFSNTFSRTNTTTVTDVTNGHNIYYARCWAATSATSTRDAYAPACSIAFDVGISTQMTGICYQCLNDSQCGPGYTCNTKNNTCLPASSVDAQCYVEGITTTCLRDSDCTASVQGGVCKAGVCEYARCLNTTTTSCDPAKGDADCAGGDGICNVNTSVCEYSYDCAYGPGMGLGVAKNYATSSIPVMPKMPLGVQANGEACTQPTPTAPNNCEGINGCLYYNYNSNGTPIVGSNNSVANCLNKPKGGTGCVYYADTSASLPTDYPCAYNTNPLLNATCANGSTCPASGVCPQKINCLADTTSRTLPGVSNNTGVPQNCFVVDKGNGKKEYDCSAVDGCYYYADGSIDCTYTDGVAVSGNGCLYEPNPAGAIFCPGTSKAPTAGNNFVQCLLNPDATLPGFATGTSSSALLPCKTDTDCPANNLCINGTCYLQCQPGPTCIGGGPACPSGDACPAAVGSPGICPSVDCRSSQICAVPPVSTVTANTVPACPGAVPPSGTTLAFGTSTTTIGLTSPTNAYCKYNTTDTSPSLFTNPSSVAFNPFPPTAPNTTHSVVVPVTPPLPTGINPYYAQCQDPATLAFTTTCSLTFNVGQACSSAAQCAGGTPCIGGTTCPNGAACPAAIGSTDICPTLQCIKGTCQPPICTDATVTDAVGTTSTILPVAIPSLYPSPQSATVQMTTKNNGVPFGATCKYSQSYPNQIQTALEQYTAMLNTFTPGGTSNHASTISPALDSVYYPTYVLCQETTTENITPLCQIPFSVNVCGPNFQCQNGYACSNTTGGAGVCIPYCQGAVPPAACTFGGPPCADGQTCPATGYCPLPLAYGTSNTDIGLTTDLNASCKYDTTSSSALYDVASATLFSTTGAMSHRTNVTGLSTGSNAYFAQCVDSAPKQCTLGSTTECGAGATCLPDPASTTGGGRCPSSVCAIPFRVGGLCDNNAQCSGGGACAIGTLCSNGALCTTGTCPSLVCINDSCQLPICDNATPTGLVSSTVLTSGTPMTLTTSTSTDCAYSNVFNTPYASMTPFATTGGIAHTTGLPGSDLTTGNNIEYVGCRQTALPNQINYCQISFLIQDTYCPTGQYRDTINNVCCDYGTMWDTTVPVPACLSSTWQTFCEQFPTSAICSTYCQNNPTDPLCTIFTGPPGMLSCNTLGITFFNTAIAPSGTCSLVAILLALLLWFAWFIGLLAVLSGLRAAYLYVTSVGDEKRLLLARSYLIYTTIGVIVAIASFGIVAIARSIFDI